jgi:hypothetical protein
MLTSISSIFSFIASVCFTMDLVKCFSCSRGVTAGTSFCVKHVVSGVGRPFVTCSVAQCELPCRGGPQCVVHMGGVARSAFEEDVLELHRKKLLKKRLASLGISRSQHAVSDDEDEDADVAVPSWRAHVFTSSASPLLQAHLEEDYGVAFEGGRRAKLRKVEQMYSLQVSRLEDILRSCEQYADDAQLLAAVRPNRHVPEPRAPDLILELAQREAGLALCKHKACSALALGPSPFCVAHVSEDVKQTLFTVCSVCKVSVLRTINPGVDTCPAHTPPAPKMKKPTAQQ